MRGGNYILPTDVPNVQPGQETLLARTSLGESDIVSDLQGRGVRVAVVVLDACRNNPFKRPDTRAIGGERGCVRSDPVQGVFSIYSAGIGPTALDQLGDADTNLVKTLTVRHDADCAAMAARSPAVQAAGGAFVVQVSAQKTEDEARVSYQVLQQKFPCVLSGRDPIIRRAELGQSGTWYRVHVGSFATSEQATALCNNLKDAGGRCIVQREGPDRSQDKMVANPVQKQTLKPLERSDQPAPRHATPSGPARRCFVLTGQRFCE